MGYLCVCMGRACDLFANLPGPLALITEATPASLPLLWEYQQYPAVIDPCRK